MVRKKEPFSLRSLTRAAVLLALLVVIQAVTAPMGQYLTGSAVNFLLVCAVLLTDRREAIAIALLSPFLAKLFGIGPGLLPIVPVISLANTALICGYLLLLHGAEKTALWRRIAAVIVAAALKYAVLSAGVSAVLAMFPEIPQKTAAVLSVTFGITQMFTALIGGTAATAAAAALWETGLFKK